MHTFIFANLLRQYIGKTWNLQLYSNYILIMQALITLHACSYYAFIFQGQIQ